MPQTREQRLDQLARGRATRLANLAKAKANAEAVDVLTKQIADMNQSARLGLDQTVVAAAAEGVAARYDAERDPITGGDLTAMAAIELAAAGNLDRNTLQDELQSVGAPVVRPDGILSREEERARSERNRAEVVRMMSAPSSKRANQLQALQLSPPISFYCPIDIPDGNMNGVPIIIYEGMIPPKTPGSLGLGCIMVAQFVEHVMARRGWAAADTRRLKMTQLLDPEVDEARNHTASRPPAGIY